MLAHLDPTALSPGCLNTTRIYVMYHSAAHILRKTKRGLPTAFHGTPPLFYFAYVPRTVEHALFFVNRCESLLVYANTSDKISKWNKVEGVLFHSANVFPLVNYGALLGNSEFQNARNQRQKNRTEVLRRLKMFMCLFLFF